jgi:hypothetical protein
MDVAVPGPRSNSRGDRAFRLLLRADLALTAALVLLAIFMIGICVSMLGRATPPLHVNHR